MINRPFHTSCLAISIGSSHTDRNPLTRQLQRLLEIVEDEFRKNLEPLVELQQEKLRPLFHRLPTRSLSLSSKPKPPTDARSHKPGDSSAAQIRSERKPQQYSSPHPRLSAALPQESWQSHPNTAFLISVKSHDQEISTTNPKLGFVPILCKRFHGKRFS